MAVEDAFGPVVGPRDRGADAGYDGGADGDVGDKVPVHDVNVQPIGTFVLDYSTTFVGEGAEVGG